MPFVRICADCGPTYGDAFYQAPANPSGLDTYCRTCKARREAVRLYRQPFEYLERFWIDAGRACPICNRALPDFPAKAAHVDHDHKSGRVRGVLCSSCNRALGYLGESTETVARALAYLCRR